MNLPYGARFYIRFLPYGTDPRINGIMNDDNAVKMVGHHDCGINGYLLISNGEKLPYLPNN